MKLIILHTTYQVVAMLVNVPKFPTSSSYIPALVFDFYVDCMTLTFYCPKKGKASSWVADAFHLIAFQICHILSKFHNNKEQKFGIYLNCVLLCDRYVYMYSDNGTEMHCLKVSNLTSCYLDTF